MGSTACAEGGNPHTVAERGWSIAQAGGISGGSRAVPALLLLFPRGGLPGLATLQELAKRGKVPGLAVDGLLGGNTDEFAEVAISGLSFQLAKQLRVGEQGSALSKGLEKRIATILERDFHALSLHAGPNIAGGAAMPPVLQEQFSIGAALGAGLPECLGLCWAPSGAFETAERLAHLAREWKAEGKLPVDYLFALGQELDGGLASKGLGIFTGQELRLEPQLTLDQGDAERLAQRIALHLFSLGSIEEALDVTLPDRRTLRLEPSPNGRFVRAFPR